VTGCIAIDTTSGGADVVAVQAYGANCLVFVADSALLKRVFSTTAQQAIFITIQAATSVMRCPSKGIWVGAYLFGNLNRSDSYIAKAFKTQLLFVKCSDCFCDFH
jgi:hypothetical protein